MNVNNESFLAVPQSVTRCIKSVFESPSISKKETMITMITKNLTYDDPGMFIKSLVCDESDRLIQDATVIWLINQVIWLSNEPQFYW